MIDNDIFMRIRFILITVDECYQTHLSTFFHLLSYLSLFLSLCLLSLSLLPTDQVAVVCHQDNVYFNYCDVDAQRCNLMIELWKTA